MSDFIQLKCTNCGGELTQNPQDNSYSCKACGAKYVLKFEHGGIQIERILDAKLQGVQTGVSILASEMAIQRLKEEIRSLSYEISNFETAFKEQEDKLVGILASIKLAKAEFTEGKIPDEQRYSVTSYILALAILIPLSSLFLIVSVSSENSNGNNLGAYLFLALLSIGLTIRSILNLSQARQARSTYFHNNRRRLREEIEVLQSTEASLRRSIDTSREMLLRLKKELAEKQKELEWHLQNVKMKPN